MEIRIPEQWQCIREPDGIWGCYDPDEDTGTIWLDFDVYQTGNTPVPPIDTWQSLRRMLAGDDKSVNSHIIHVDEDHKIINVAKDAFDPEAGEILNFSHWHHMGRIDATSLAIVHLTLVISPNMLTDGEGLLLAQEIERGLTEAKINWERLAKSGNA